MSVSVLNTVNRDIDGLSLKYGPVLMAIKFCPKSLKVTISQFPEGVSEIVVILSASESGKSDI